MELLKQKILTDGIVREGNILKVDNFLNHQLDIEFLNELGKEFHRIFKEKNITKILTIEASGIAIAAVTAQYFNVPVLFAKKAKSLNLDGNLYTSTVKSYTYGKEYTITVAKKFLGENEHLVTIYSLQAITLLSNLYIHPNYITRINSHREMLLIQMLLLLLEKCF